MLEVKSENCIDKTLLKFILAKHNDYQIYKLLLNYVNVYFLMGYIFVVNPYVQQLWPVIRYSELICLSSNNQGDFKT